MNVLITGATGFVGKHLLSKLLAEGYSVRCLVRDSAKLSEYNRNSSVELWKGDILDKKSLNGIGKDIDIVVHLAAMGHVSAISEEAFKEFVNINVRGTQSLIEECQKNDIKKFIHFSSTAAMGLIKKSIVDETTPCQPKSPYQKSKYDSELLALDYFKKKGFPSIVIRPCMIYGPGGTGEFHKMVRLMKKGMFPKVGLGKNLTPMVYVEDVVNAAEQCIRLGAPGEVYLVASEQSYVLDYIRNIIIAELKINPPYLYVPVTIALAGAKLLETVATILGKQPIVTYKNIDSTVTDRYFDITKIKNELKYSQTMSVEEGIKRTIEWYKEEHLI